MAYQPDRCRCGELNCLTNACDEDCCVIGYDPDLIPRNVGVGGYGVSAVRPMFEVVADLCCVDYHDGVHACAYGQRYRPRTPDAAAAYERTVELEFFAEFRAAYADLLPELASAGRMT